MRVSAPSALVAAIRSVLEPREEVREAYLFGSAARGDAARHSDVDVVRLNAAPPLLYHRVLRDGSRILARDLRETTVREGRALSRWCDWAPCQARIDATLGERHRRGKLGR